VRQKSYISILSLIYVMFLVVYSYMYIYVIPWDNIVELRDIESYIVQFREASADLTNYSISGENIWKFIVYKISSLSVFNSDFRDMVKFISFMSLIILSYFTIQRANYAISALIFLNPLVVFLIIGQIRIALAFSLLLIAFRCKNIILISTLIVIAVGIHTASLFYVLMFFILHELYRVFPNRKFYIYSIVLGLLTALFLKYGIDIILNFLGDRREMTLKAAASSSIKFSIFWILLSLLLAFKARVIHGHQKYIIAFSIFTGSLFFFSTVFDFYGLRFIALSVPLFIISINYLPKDYKLGTYSLFIFYTGVQWIMIL
jgi:hypothetical protein